MARKNRKARNEDFREIFKYFLKEGDHPEKAGEKTAEAIEELESHNVYLKEKHGASPSS